MQSAQVMYATYYRCVVCQHQRMVTPQVWEEVPESQIYNLNFQAIFVLKKMSVFPVPLGWATIQNGTSTCEGCTRSHHLAMTTCSHVRNWGLLHTEREQSPLCVTFIFFRGLHNAQRYHVGSLWYFRLSLTSFITVRMNSIRAGDSACMKIESNTTQRNVLS